MACIGMPASALSTRMSTFSSPSSKPRAAPSSARRKCRAAAAKVDRSLPPCSILRDGDELVVARLDRLGRDTRDMLNLLHECEQRGAWAMVITVLGMLAQMERRFIKEQQRDGIERAKAGRVYKGGTPRMDRAKIVALQQAEQRPYQTVTPRLRGLRRSPVVPTGSSRAGPQPNGREARAARSGRSRVR